MERLWRLLRRTLLAALLLAGLAVGAWAQETAVSSMDTSCTVEQDGACTLTIQAVVDFAPDTQDFAIPISPVAKEISCTGADWTLGSSGDYKLIRLKGPLSGRTTLTISYRLAETVSDDGKQQNFTVNLLYPAWSCPIQNYRVTARLPQRFDAMPVFLSGYYGDLIDNYMEISVSEGVIQAQLNAKQVLQDHEAMSLSLELPEGYFDLRFLAGKTVRVDRLLFLGFLALAALYWLVFLRNLPILPKRQAMPPEGSNPGEYPYVLTARKPDLALMVVHWASLGYLTIHRTRKGRLYLNREIDMDTERKHFEGQIFDALFARGDQCDLRSAEYLKAKALAREETVRYWQDRCFDPKAGAPGVLRLLVLAAGLALCLACVDLWVASKSWRWPVIALLTLGGGAACLGLQQAGGLLLRRHPFRSLGLAIVSAALLFFVGRRTGFQKLMLLNLLAQLGVGLLLRCGGRRTREGAALGAGLLGYRRYLISASSQTLRSNLEADPQYFYRVLPYADALGAARIFALGFADARLEACDWLAWEGKPLHSALGFYQRYCRVLAGLRGERDPGGRRRKPKGPAKPVSTRTRPHPQRPTLVRQEPRTPEQEAKP
ncbi:MAG: DUF2207 domain-containing protein [Oscillospiraceae bacterium]|nr:DUF2207 domain-containing protein [Oscillospiraceae bacterium]